MLALETLETLKRCNTPVSANDTQTATKQMHCTLSTVGLALLQHACSNTAHCMMLPV